MRRADCASSEPGAAVFAAALLCAALLSACRSTSVADPGDEPPVVFTEAGILLAGGETPAEDDAPWQPQSLPDDWSRSRPHHGGDAWYRVQFVLRPDQVRLTAIYVPRVSMMATPFVNGTRLADGGRFSEPMTRLWYRPQLYWVPSALLKAGTNVLHLRIRCYPDNQGGVSEIHLGAPAQVVQQWRRHVFRQVTAMEITTGITAALGMLVLVAWAVLRRDPAYGYFGLAAVFWAVHATFVLTVDIPTPTLYWEVLIVTSLVWVVVAMMMFALRFAGLRRPGLERAVVVFAVAAPLLLWGAGITRIFGVSNALLLVLLGIGAYEFKLLFDFSRRSRSVESLLLVGAAVFVLGLGAHDWLNRQGTWAYAEPFTMHYGVPVLFGAVVWNLLGQAAAGRRSVETLNRDLEARVTAKAAGVERFHERARAAHAAEALAGERERIMRDMHDGVGSQLIAARQLAEHGSLAPGELAILLDECIDDLRLMIDSLETADGDLLTVLGNLRYRMTPRLARQGLALRWEVLDLPPIVGLTPRGTLQILRVVQEAIANVLKHAQASELVVAAAPSDDGRHVRLSVRDNGRGFRAGAHQAGRGLLNMQQRAAAVAATLHVDGTPGACVVTLTLPLDDHGSVNIGTELRDSPPLPA